MQANQVWQAVLSELRDNLPRQEFEAVLKTSTIAAFTDGQAVVAMPNAHAVEWSETRLTGSVERIMGRIVGYPVSVRFAVREGDNYYLPGVPQPSARRDDAPRPASNGNGHGGPPAATPPGLYPSRVAAARRDAALSEEGALLNLRYDFEHFIVGSGNRLAHAASLAVADSPGHAYNPLFIYGGGGLGKTHLLHAIGHQAM